MLFGALADSGRIKQRKNGSYRMILKGLDEIDWFTDRPYREEGTWKPKKLIRKWDSLFETSAPNAQTTLEVDGRKRLVTFEIFKPKMKKGKMIFNLKSDWSGEDSITGLKGKLIKDLNDNFQAKFTALKGRKLDNISLFIDHEVDEASATPSCNLTGSTLTGAYISGATLTNADLTGATLTNGDLTYADLNNSTLIGATLTGAYLSGATLTNANLFGANLADANLTSADLTAADLTDANLINANLTRADLTAADLTNAGLYSVKYDSMTTWEGITWDNTICPDGTNSNDPGNPTCGF